MCISVFHEDPTSTFQYAVSVIMFKPERALLPDLFVCRKINFIFKNIAFSFLTADYSDTQALTRDFWHII